MFEFRLLGSLDLKGPEGTLRSVLAQPKRVALLAYLAAATPNGFHRRDKLLGLFWPESDQEHGRGSLRKALYLLRQSLGEEAIVSRGDEEIGLAEGVLWCDAVAFEEALEAGNPEEALDLYRGDLLEGFFISEAPEFERWLEGGRERLRGRASEAAWTLAEQEEGDGSAARAARWAKKAVSFSPDDEGAIRRLLELLDRVGDRAGAVKEYEGIARRLKAEYEIEPSPETRALIAAIREREVAAAGGSLQRPLKAQGGARAVAPGPVARAPAMEREDESRPISLPRVLGSYALVSLAVLVAVHIFTIQLGLPDWFFPSAVVVLLVCLPIIVATALVQGAAVTARAAGADAGPSSAASRWLTWRNSIVGGSLAFVLLGVAVTGYTGMRERGIGPWGTLIGQGVVEERDLIVLADFEDHTSDSLALALTELVRVELEQSPAVRVADADYVGRVLERMEREPNAELTYDLAREVAIREGLKAVVTGEVHRVGGSYVLSLGLVAAGTGQTLVSIRETASDLDATIPAIEHMLRKLRERIGESLKTVRATPPLRRVRTASLEALRLYTEARQAYSRELAIDGLNRAVEIDTLFAAAYLGRAQRWGNVDRAKRIADATRAYELRHRLPLWERYWVESGYHLAVTGDMEKVVGTRRALVDLEPENSRWWGNLAWVYHLLRDYERAEELYRREFELDSLAFDSWSNFARSRFNQGKFEEAWETLRRFEQAEPGNPRIPLYRAEYASSQGDYDAAEFYLRVWRERVRESLFEQGLFNRRMGQLAQVQGRLARAEDYIRNSIALFEEADRPSWYFWGTAQLAGLRLWFRSDTIGALEMYEHMFDTFPFESLPLPQRPYPVNSLYAFAGVPERAKEMLAEWDTVLPPERYGYWWERYRHSSRGTVALAEGRAEEALAEFRWVQERALCPICALPLLGRAHELAGQPDSALAMYERYLITPWDRRTISGADLPDHGGDSYWLPVVYERLGDLYEQRGDTARAIHYYGKLVDLWRDADPELQPRVEAARRAMEALAPDT